MGSTEWILGEIDKVMKWSEGYDEAAFGSIERDEALQIVIAGANAYISLRAVGMREDSRSNGANIATKPTGLGEKRE